MGVFIAQRVGASVITAVLLLILAAMFKALLPGDAVDLILAEARDPAAEQRLREELGLDEAAPVAMAKYALSATHGDLGSSLWSGEPVSTMIVRSLPPTLELTAIAIVISILIAIPVGIVSAVQRDSGLDYLARTLAVVGLTIPSFVLGTLVVTLPALWWGWSPPFRYIDITDDPVANLRQMWLPGFILGVLLAASVMRITRTMVLEVLHQDYIRTARAKGLGSTRVIVRHALPNALIPVITLSGVQVAFLLGGSAVVEQIFGLPGMGRLLVDSIRLRDYPVVQGIILVSGVMIVALNVAIDVAAGLLDPRIRFS